MQNDRPDHVAAIDALRFACAAGVVAHHLAPLGGSDAVGRMPPAVFSWFGWVGVQLFFVISGYVIAQSCEATDARSFLRRRLLRLAPAAWICATLTAGAQLVVGALPSGEIAGRWAGALVFLPLAYPIDGAYWTLSVELCFYLSVAALMAVGRTSVHRIERFGIALGLIGIAFWAVTGWTGTADRFLEHRFDWRVGMMPFGMFFGLGILLHAVRVRGARPARLGWAVLLFGGGCWQILLRAGYQAGDGLALYPVAPLAAFAGGIAIIAVSRRLQTPLTRAVGRQRLATLGLMTYPLYLLHHVIGAALILIAIGAGVPPVLAAIGGVATIVALAWYVTVRIEPQLRGWLARVPPKRVAAGPKRVPPGAGYRAASSAARPSGR